MSLSRPHQPADKAIKTVAFCHFYQKLFFIHVPVLQPNDIIDGLRGYA